MKLFLPIIAIAILIMPVVGVWIDSVSSGPTVRVIALPQLESCSCDSAYRCMSDQEYMQLVAWQEENKWFIATHCEGC